MLMMILETGFLPVLRRTQRRFCAHAFTALVLGLGIGVVAVPAQVAQAVEPQVPEKTRVLTAAVPRAFPPQYQVDSEGRPYGFAIDVMDAIARRAGVRVEYNVMGTWKTVNQALAAGAVDLIPNQGITEARKKLYDFTPTIEAFRVSLFVRSNSRKVTGPDALSGRVAGVVVSNVARKQLSNRRDIKELKLYADYEALLLALISGHIDVMAAPEPVMWKLAREARIEARIMVTGEPLREIKRAIAVRKGNVELLAVLGPAAEAFVRSREFSDIYAKWYGAPEPYWTTRRVAAALALGAFLALVLAGLWRYRAVSRLNVRLQKVIDERVQAEATLLESEERFSKVFHAVPALVGIATIDDGRLYDVNETWLEAFGYDRDEVIGKTVLELGIWVDPDQRRGMVERLKKDGAVHNFEARFRDKNGNFRDHLASVELIDLDGKSRLLFVSHDITERKRSEQALVESRELLRAVIDAVPAMINVKDMESRYLLMNSYQASIYGTTPEAAIGKTAADLLSPEYGKRTAALDRQVIETGKPVTSYEETYPNPSEGENTWLTTKVPFADAEGNLKNVVTVALDISERKKQEEALSESEDRFRSLSESAFEGLLIHDSGVILDANDRLAEMFGYQPQDMENEFVLELIAAESVETVREKLLWEVTDTYEAIGRRKDGSKFPVELSSSPVAYKGQTQRALAVRDLTERKKSEETLRKLSRVVEQSPAMVFITNTGGIIEYVNPRFMEITGYTKEEVIGKTPRILKSGHTSPDYYNALWESITSGREWRGELSNKKKNGELIWVNATISPIKGEDGNSTHYLCIEEDITVRKEQEDRLIHQANYDSLTGLPNRLLAMDRLTRAIAVSRREKRSVVVMFVDLDNFKKVNDSYGHQAGDRLLVEAAHRLDGCIREVDTVARLGGDEFLVILPGVDGQLHAETVAQKIHDALARPFLVEGREVVTTTSIGLTLSPNDGDDPHVLLRNADGAMYQAKAEGRNTYRFFTPEMNERAVQRMEMEFYLRHALEQDELFLEYQPVVDAHSLKVVGAEALIRWQSPNLGLVMPDHFIPLAEEIGLITAIGEWVLEQACRQAAKWQSNGRLPYVAVNVSSRQFETEGLVDAVTRAYEESDLPPGCLHLEITEGMLLDDAEETKETLEKLHRLGASLSIDDFGTGYSALSYLKRFPFDTLKIDRAFVHELPGVRKEGALATAIIAMAHNLSLNVIAEGVEKADQIAFLRSHSCDLFQGHFFSRPVAADEMAKIVNGEYDLSELAG